MIIQGLANTLSGWGGKDGSIVVVSHDREFVNSIAKRIWIIDIDQNKIHDFSGTYDEYLATKVNC